MYVHLEQHSPPPRTHELPPHNHAEFLATISQWNHFCRQSGAAVLFSLTAKNIRESNFPSTQPSHQRCFMKTNTYHSSIMCHFNDQQFCRNLYVWKKYNISTTVNLYKNCYQLILNRSQLIKPQCSSSGYTLCSPVSLMQHWLSLSIYIPITQDKHRVLSFHLPD